MGATVECPQCGRRLRVASPDNNRRREERLARYALAESCPRNKPNRVGCQIAEEDKAREKALA